MYTDCVPPRVPLSNVSGRVPTDCVRVEQSNPDNQALLSRRRRRPHRARISRRGGGSDGQEISGDVSTCAREIDASIFHVS